jgi:hypothetical protein
MGKPHNHHNMDMPGQPEAMGGECVKCMNKYFREECGNCCTVQMSYCKDVVEVAKAASIKTGPDIAGLDGYTASMAVSAACQVWCVLFLAYPYNTLPLCRTQ